MLKRINFTSYFFIILFSSIILFGCKKKSEAESEVVSVKGSDTMVNLSQKWAEAYMKVNPNATIQVTGGGSGVGIAALLNGTVQLANASRELKEDEKKKGEQLKIQFREIPVALDGICVIVSKDNKLEELTMAQIKDIFTGKIKDWSEVGGDAGKIVLYGRENSSGTYEFFKEKVLNKMDFDKSTAVLSGTAQLGESVAKDKMGIAYGGVGYFAKRTDVKILKVKKDANTPGIAPAANGEVNYAAIYDNSYPITRYLYCFTNGEPVPAVQKFLDFILSEEGQNLVKNMEYIPLPKK